MRKTSSGFTLIELLVVIAIIAILAAILFPVFAQAREKARQTSCLNQTKQLGLSFQQYIQDYNERLPGPAPYGAVSMPSFSITTTPPAAGRSYGFYDFSPWCTQPCANWVPMLPVADANFKVENGAIFPYAKNAGIYRCPSHKKVVVGAPKLTLSYSMNVYAGFRKMAEASQVSKTPLLIDESATINDGYFSPWPSGSYQDQPTYAHSNGSNLTYADGHSGWINKDAAPNVAMWGSNMVAANDFWRFGDETM